MNIITEKDIDRFWSKVKIGNPDECWEWQSSLDEKGYGHFQFSHNNPLGRDNPRSHRVSWVIRFGKIPENMCVCHTCDNRSCVNPDHLFLGTYEDNNKDRKEKGRSAVGENAPTAKLTEKDVVLIKKLISKGATQRAIAKQFNVRHVTIGNIARGKTWRYLTEKIGGPNDRH